MEFADIRKFLTVLSTLKNIEPFYKSIEFCCERAGSAAPDVVEKLRDRLLGAGLEDNVMASLKPQLGNCDEKKSDDESIESIQREMKTLKSNMRYSNGRFCYGFFHNGYNPMGEMLVKFFKFWLAHAEEGVGESQLIDLINEFKAGVDATRGPVDYLYTNGADFLLELIAKRSSSLHVWMNVLNKYVDKCDYPTEEAREYLRKKWVDEYSYSKGKDSVLMTALADVSLAMGGISLFQQNNHAFMTKLRNVLFHLDASDIQSMDCRKAMLPAFQDELLTFSKNNVLHSDRSMRSGPKS
jgi:hypothetical protein